MGNDSVKNDEEYSKHGYQKQEFDGEEFVAVEEADDSYDDIDDEN